MEPLMTLPEVAASARVTVPTVRRWIRFGHLDAVRLPGGALRVRRTDCDALTASERRAAAEGEGQ